MTKRILLTGFEPFGGQTVNPSMKVIQHINLQGLSSHTIKIELLPVVAKKLYDIIPPLLTEYQPDIIISLGESGGQTAVNLERVAVNLLDFGQPDNSGAMIQDQPIISDGPAAYWSTLPLRQLQTALIHHNIPVMLSLSAGAYMCNQLFYLCRHWAQQHRPACLAGFIHLPYLPEQVNNSRSPMASLPLETQIKAITTVIQHFEEITT
ncbi:MAG: pyroglutamyl-peptidase I [Chloroflexota bacterium]